jgi:hypothetical protein
MAWDFIGGHPNVYDGCGLAPSGNAAMASAVAARNLISSSLYFMDTRYFSG